MWHDVDGSFAKAATYARQAPCQAIGSAPGTSTASIPVSSVCPDAISASPHDAFLPSMTCVSDPCDHFTKQAPHAAPDRILSALYSRPSLKEPEPDPTGPRLNPRRTAGGHHRLTGPPILTRQSDRRINFVDNLVDSSTQVVEAIWPCSSVGSHNEPSYNTGLPLSTFIQETLRRSRTSYSTLQLALYYLILLKPHVPRHLLASEQPNDRSSDHPLQCGRRMFLAALILASKYLQDRNYSARAWSRMSGLNTQEINGNEIAFLMAINWKLHVVEEVFQRWNDIVLRFTSPGPSSPGGAMLTHASQLTDWKQVILGLDPELTRIEPLLSSCRTNPGKTSDLSFLSPRSILNSPQECATRANAALNPAPTSAFIEPTLTTSLGTSRLLPTTSALVSTSMAGSLPTPRPTPQSSWLSTPAVSAAPQSSARSSAMSVAMTQAHCCLGTSQNLDCLHQSLTSPPQGYYCAARRSSLANSVSTASSPESMISDSSRSSHCSSAYVTSSSCPSYYNGPGRCSLPTRSRVSRLWSDRLSTRSMVPSLAEDHERCLSSPPAEVHVGPTVKSGGANAETRLARRERELEDQARDAASDAARVLQDLHKHGYSANVTVTAKTGLKRNRAGSAGDSGLRDNMHNMLAGRCDSVERQWTEARVQAAALAPLGGSGKRVCCSAEAASAHDAFGLRGRGLYKDVYMKMNTGLRT